MSRLSQLFSTGLLGGAMGQRDRTTDGLTRLRFALETLASSKKYIFTPAVRAEILSELYETFWGQHMAYFAPTTLTKMPPYLLLSEVQNRYVFHGADTEDPVIPGRSCGHIFVKGESCYRCK